MFLKKICWPLKVEKTTLKSCSEFLKSTFFPLLPWLPVPGKDICSRKKYLLEDICLYSELNLAPSEVCRCILFFSLDQLVTKNYNLQFPLYWNEYGFSSLWIRFSLGTVFPHIVSAETILFWIRKSKGHST